MGVFITLLVVALATAVLLYAKALCKPLPRASLTRADAAQVLGVAENANEDAVNEAYRRLMQKNHPDHGGSAYLASLINQAREVMLRR